MRTKYKVMEGIMNCVRRNGEEDRRAERERDRETERER